MTLRMTNGPLLAIASPPPSQQLKGLKVTDRLKSHQTGLQMLLRVRTIRHERTLVVEQPLQVSLVFAL